MDYLLVTPADLRAHWPQISTSLDAVLARGDQDWIKEDVYAALRTGQSACHMAFNDQGFAGLMITNPVRTEFSGQTNLHVWIAHNEGKDDVIELGMSLLRQMAQKGGFSKITFASARLGWARRHKLVTAVYEVAI